MVSAEQQAVDGLLARRKPAPTSHDPFVYFLLLAFSASQHQLKFSSDLRSRKKMLIDKLVVVT